jgi:predicted amidohydrolase YtcJ
MLVFSAADFEDFLQPRPDLPEGMEDELERGAPSGGKPLAVPLHATYDESISRMLDVFEKVNRDIRSTGCTGSSTMRKPLPSAIFERVKALGGGLRCSTVWPSRGNILSYCRQRGGEHIAGGENAGAGRAGRVRDGRDPRGEL